LNNYMLNGGDVTLKALKKLKDKSPDTVEYIIEYLKEAPLYETVTAGGKDFLLCHSGLDNFSPEKVPEDYTVDELLWAWPEIDDRYYDDIITVFGHTPTMSYDKEMKGKILKTDTWIDVDVGVPYDNPPALLRLDDLQEFYL
ncbi:MAG: calcineurin, partial [Alphaproteobacteria bacterium]|nr:calcineurin [Alphaproteobacteria bacterium]